MTSLILLSWPISVALAGLVYSHSQTWQDGRSTCTILTLEAIITSSQLGHMTNIDDFSPFVLALWQPKLVQPCAKCFEKIKQLSKVGQNQETLISIFANFFGAVVENLFMQRSLCTSLCPNADFPDISLFLKMISFKLFGNLWGNL